MLMVAHPSEAGTRVCPTCGERFPTDFLVCPRDATTLRAAADASSDPWIGRVLADTYQIIEQLGEGGMGRIFSARHLRLRDRRVAVKVLGEEFVREPEIVARFEQEVESASRVVHPHVIEVYDAGHTAEGVHFLVTEMLEGEDLGALIERTKKPLAVDLAVMLARQACLALGAAHACGIVHRDVKPENVFVIQVDGHPFVKVLDFGISKVIQRGGTKLTRTGAVLGTPAYMSPEQARGGDVDLRTDVYGVGATLYTALAGRAPFEGDDPAMALSKLVSEEPPRLRSIASSVPGELEVIVQRAMAKDPRDRYSSAAELEEALAAFATASGPALVRAPTLVQGSGSYASIDAPRGARLAVLFYAVVLGVFWIAGAATAAATLVRHARHASSVTSTESFLVLAGVGLATFVLSASVLGRTREAWPNSVRILELMADRRRALFFALAVYALGTLGVRFATTFLITDDGKGFDLVLDVGIFSTSVVVAVIIAAFAWLGRVVGRFRRRRV